MTPSMGQYIVKTNPVILIAKIWNASLVDIAHNYENPALILSLILFRFIRKMSNS